MGGFLVNNIFTAIQNRDGEALSRMSGYEHQYTNNDNVVNMSAERLVDALFKQLKQLFPAAVVTNLKTPEQEVAAKQQWIAAFAEGGSEPVNRFLLVCATPAPVNLRSGRRRGNLSSGVKTARWFLASPLTM